MNYMPEAPGGHGRARLAARVNGLWRMTGAACLGLVVLLGPTAQRLGAATSLDDLTGPWQLFVDDFPVASRTNVVRTYHPFQKYASNPVLVTDRPWEGPVYLYGTVLPNETHTGYRMWYHTLRPEETNNDGSLELYATSPDGVTWTKPILNLRSWHGSTANNMYFTRSTAGGMTSVMHTPWDPDPNQLYKFMNREAAGYYAGWSPDGIHVTDAPNNPVFTGGSDVGQFCWNPHTQQYLGYVKINSYVNGLKRRSVALTTTTNIATWSAESLILEPDAIDDRWVPAGTVQRTHLYGLSAFPYESMYLGFLWIFRATDAEGYYVGPCFVELVSSRDGVHWTREEGDRPPLLPLGAGGAWDDGMVFTARAPIVEGDIIKLWYGGFDQVHGFPLTQTAGSIGLATLRKDGFASLDAGPAVGLISTRTVTGAAGSLRVNYRAAGGWLKVEVLDPGGDVLPGYSQADCAPLTGDSVNQLVTWTTHAELPAEPSTFRLRFILQNASLYSFMAGNAGLVGDPPAITRQPVNSAVLAGSTATFSVTAAGASPPSWRWQKDQADLFDGGHYSGCATATLTIAGADTSDAASYRCVVGNAYGSATSSVARLMVATSVFGARTLAAIPALAGDTSNEGRAISPDGRWVVGLSGGAHGFLYDITRAAPGNVLSADGAQAAILTGVGYRTRNGQQEAVLSGLSAGWPTVFMTTNGTTFANQVQTSGGTIQTPHLPAANGLAGTSSEAFYAAWSDDNSSGYQEYVGKFSGRWPMSPQWDIKGIPKPMPAGLNGIASTGRAVGWRGSPRGNYVLDWRGTGTPAAWVFSALDGTTNGEPFAVSADGTTVFGQSPVLGGRPGNWGYKAVFAPAMPGPAAQLSLHELPSFPNTSGTSGNAAAPYGCTPDGIYAVGMSYRGAETAVLWDTSDPDPAKWTVLDLMQYAAAEDMGGAFTRLTRAYSIGVSATRDLVIAGVGIAEGVTRAFLMTVPTPIRSTVKTSGSPAAGVTFTFASLGSATLTNYLEYTTTLRLPHTWNPVASAPCAGNLTTLCDPSPPDAARFYRIRVR